MEIKKIISPSCSENCYFVRNGKSGIIIDPGVDSERILSECGGLKIEYIFLTHCHYDHVFSASFIKSRTGALVVSSKKCAKNLPDSVKNASCLFNDDRDFMPPDVILPDRGGIKTAVGEVFCIYTPGHTDCSVCYVIGGHIFSGDTLFRLSVGRWDLKTGNLAQLEDSVKNKLYSMPEDMALHPGHGEDSTVGYEKKNNLYIKADR